MFLIVGDEDDVPLGCEAQLRLIVEICGSLVHCGDDVEALATQGFDKTVMNARIEIGRRRGHQSAAYAARSCSSIKPSISSRCLP